jgi:hypothetical protein
VAIRLRLTSSQFLQLRKDCGSLAEEQPREPKTLNGFLFPSNEPLCFPLHVQALNTCVRCLLDHHPLSKAGLSSFHRPGIRAECVAVSVPPISAEGIHSATRRCQNGLNGTRNLVGRRGDIWVRLSQRRFGARPSSLLSPRRI